MRFRKPKHTQGPWEVVSRPRIGDGLVAGVNARLKIVSKAGTCDEEEAHNAELIARSPAMFDMLREVYRTLKEPGMMQAVSWEKLAEDIRATLPAGSVPL